MIVQHHSKTTTNIQLEVVSHPNFYICCGRRPTMLYHSNKTSWAEHLHGAIHFLGFCKPK